MAFSRPTLPQLVSRVCGDIQTKLAGVDAYLRNSVERVIAVALAGLAHMLHGHLVWLSRQLFADTAEAEFLARHAAICGLIRKTASKATGTLPITGSNGSTCQQGALWQRLDGVRYVQDADATIAGGVATAALTAEEAGAAGNAEIGTKLELVAPVAGITSSATLAAAIDNGADDETYEELRARVIQRKGNPPSGGGTGDYVRWALEVAGVTRAWEFPLRYGAGTVGLTFARDNESPHIPDAGEVATVVAYLETKRPVTAALTVFSSVASPIAMSIALSPDTPAGRAAVEDQLEAFFLSNANPAGCTIYKSRLSEAISRAVGEEHHTLSVPAGDLSYSVGQFPTLGAITWL